MTNVNEKPMQGKDFVQSFSTILQDVINDVRQYFIEKILRGEFETVKADADMVVIKIDGYTFKLWVKNGEKYFSTFSDSFMELEFKPESRIRAFDVVMAEGKKLYNERIRQERLAQIERINNELKMMEA